MPRVWLFILNGAYAAFLLGLVAAGLILFTLMPDVARIVLDLPFSPPEEVQAVPDVPLAPHVERVIELPPDTIRGIDFDGGDVYALRRTVRPS